MKRSYKLFLTTILMTALLFVTMGCSGRIESQDTATDVIVDETLSDDDRNYVINLGYYDCDHMVAAPIAKDAGFFKELGLKVNVTGNGKVPQAMAAGQMDAGYIGSTGIFRASLIGEPPLIGAHNHVGGARYLVVSNDIKKPEDLIGKKLAIGAEPELNNTWVVIAQQLGIPVEKEHYETLAMSDRDAYLALKLGQIDGFTPCDPYGSLAEYEGTGYIMDTFLKLPSGEWGFGSTYALNEKFMKERPELAKRMLLAHTRAMEYIYTQPLQSAKIFAANYDVPEEVALRTLYLKSNAEGRAFTWKVTREHVENMIEFLVEYNILDDYPDLGVLLQLQLLEESGAKDFDTFIKEEVDPIFPLGMPYEEWKEKAYEVDRGPRV